MKKWYLNPPLGLPYRGDYRVSLRWHLYGLLWFLMPQWFRRWLTNGVYVYLKDYQGEITITMAWPRDDNTPIRSIIYNRVMVGPLLLHDDGTVTNDDGSDSYVHNWMPVDRNWRTEMILKGLQGFDTKGSKYS